MPAPGEVPRRFLVADVVPHGHHALWLTAVSDALATIAAVTVLVSDDLAALAGLSGGDYLRLRRGMSPAAHLATVARTATRVGAEHVVHLHSDRRVVTAWLRSRPLPVPGSAVVFSPPALHYGRAYSSPLTAAEYIAAASKEALYRSWRRRPDVRAVWTLDEEVTRRWNRATGAPAFTLPEPPAPVRPGEPSLVGRPYDAVVFGAIGRRKGLHLLAAAASAAMGPPLRLLVAGRVLPAERGYVGYHLAALRRAGWEVTLRDEWLADHEVPRVISSARCAVLAYERHKGDSRVLLEAAAAGVGVVAHSWGLLGHTVREWGLGEVVDCADPHALGAALARVCAGDLTSGAERVNRFAAAHAEDLFQAAVCAPFTGRPAPPDRQQEPTHRGEATGTSAAGSAADRPSLIERDAPCQAPASSSPVPSGAAIRG